MGGRLPEGSDLRVSSAGRGGDGVERAGAVPDGVLLVDKPAGWTSHDVVARVRRLAGTRRVGHAGTLDPMATGVLVVGIGRATRLLGHLSGQEKEYAATIRLGWATTTDDAQGERLTADVNPPASPGDATGASDPAPVPGGVHPDPTRLDTAELGTRRFPAARPDASRLDPADVLAAVARLRGPLLQRPSAVSAIKVDGRRAHARVRAGDQVELPARPVIVHRFDVLAIRPAPDLAALDLDVEVTVSAGTYVRALARDLGQALGVGGHLTALRRTRSGVFDLADARPLDQLAEHWQLLSIDEVAARAFPVVGLDDIDVARVRHGQRVTTEQAGTGLQRDQVNALLAPDGSLLALARADEDGMWRYLAVLAPQESNAAGT